MDLRESQRPQGRQAIRRKPQKKKGRKRRAWPFASGGSSLPAAFAPQGLAGAALAPGEGLAGGQATYGGTAAYAPSVKHGSGTWLAVP